ncbi:MAG: YHYH domain-containing protein [Bacteriovoracaceae bacterium]|nr:YHYH domain-containing protein [Bacteriovoracaceae bacterium]
MISKKLVLLIVTLLLSTSVFAHGGRTNSSGCHNNRKTGDYHCHNSGASTYQAPKSYDYNSPKQEKTNSYCCKVCRKGKACGDSCISRSYTCTKPSGCACDG